MEKQEEVRTELLKQREAVFSEINNMEAELRFKREYLMKLTGGLETIDILFGPRSDANPQPEQLQETDEDN